MLHAVSVVMSLIGLPLQLTIAAGQCYFDSPGERKEDV